MASEESSPEEIREEEIENEQSSDADSIKENPLSTNERSPFDKCLLMLRRANTDTEKFAALLMVTKLIKADELDESSRKQLLDTIGLNFLGRLLSTAEVPDGCPPYIFKSIALTILSCFISSCHGNLSLYRMIPSLTDILSHVDEYEDNLTLLKDVHECLFNIASVSVGRKALIDYEVMNTMVDYIISENAYWEQALSVLRMIANDFGSKMWEDEPDAFDKLILHLCKDFAVNENEEKFFLCCVLSDILLTIPSESYISQENHSWKPYLHQGLSNILFSKLNQELRNKGLHLASAVLTSLGVSWVVSGGEKGRQLFLLMVHLACIEVRMTLEDKSFEQAVDSAFQTTACYSIIEHSIKFLVNGAIELEDKQKQQQLYSALKGAFNGVLAFLNGASTEEIPTNDTKIQMFICASVRVLGAWLAEETSANKDEIYQILPFLIKIAHFNFNHNNLLSKHKKKSSVQKDLPELKEPLPDLLRFLLPGLCHLTAEDHPRHVLLNINIENLMFEYFQYQWSSLSSLKSQEDFEDSLYNHSDVIVTICNIMMNIVVQEPKRVKTEYLYFLILKFIFAKVSEVPVSTRHLQLVGSLCTLGLMILRHQYVNIQRTEFSIYRFIQAAVRFLWDAYNVEESPDNATLAVSETYKPYWGDLLELWFLSIHTLTLLLPYMPWLSDFLIESEWPQTITETLLSVKPGGIDSGLKNAYEELLCSLVQTSKPSKELLKLKGIEIVCKDHGFEKLLKAL